MCLIYQSPLYAEILTRIIPRLVKRGWHVSSDSVQHQTCIFNLGCWVEKGSTQVKMAHVTVHTDVTVCRVNGFDMGVRMVSCVE